MYKKLIEEALKARKNAYCPYSGFAVGAALLCEDGKIFTGCNVENSAAAPNCAERTAFFKAVSEGCHKFRAIAIVGAKKELEYPKEYCYPCGVCRQVMTEFCDDSFEIISAINESDYEIHTLDEIMPFAFKL